MEKQSKEKTLSENLKGGGGKREEWRKQEYLGGEERKYRVTIGKEKRSGDGDKEEDGGSLDESS